MGKNEQSGIFWTNFDNFEPFWTGLNYFEQFWTNTNNLIHVIYSGKRTTAVWDKSRSRTGWTSQAVKNRSKLFTYCKCKSPSNQRILQSAQNSVFLYDKCHQRISMQTFQKHEHKSCHEEKVNQDAYYTTYLKKKTFSTIMSKHSLYIEWFYDMASGIQTIRF